jgi:Protein of unknown function (DUF3667)
MPPLSAPACANCGADLPERPQPFCPQCGQETRLRPPTMGEFLQQFGGAYLSTEGALWRTLCLLLVRPGELTRRYLAGQRKHYVLPLRLYLTISVVVLLAMRWGADHTLEVEPALKFDTPAEKLNFTIDLGLARAGLKDGTFYCESLPQVMCKRLQRRLSLKPDDLSREVGDLKQRLLSAIGPAMFLILPGFALWLKLAWINRRLRYTEHLVFALHVHAFWFLMLGFTLLPLGGWESAAAPAVPIYTWLALKRVHGGRFWPRALRTAGVAMLYGVTLLLAMAGVILWALLF